MNIIKGYKFIQNDMKSQAGGTKWRKNIWKKHKGKIELCNSGFHACRTPFESLQYVYGGRWFIIEAKGEFLEDKRDKFVASEMRLVKELPIKPILVEFAIKCAKRCLKNFEKQYPDDDRPRKAIIAAQNWIKHPSEEIKKAAESAAWSAESAESARSAAWSAESARSAARSARSARSAESAAWSAESARSAARSAESAWSAAESAELAEKKWQERCLKKIIKMKVNEDGNE